MGSIISLGIDKLELDWGKNNFFVNYSYLFKNEDIKKIPYYYVDNNFEKEIIEYKDGYSSRLSCIKDRLELLGYSLKEIKIKYNRILKEAQDFGNDINLSFESIYRIISKIEVDKISFIKDEIENNDNGYDIGEYARKCILNNDVIRAQILKEAKVKENIYELSEFLENIDPLILVRILCENNKNINFELQWRFADVVENGWVKKEEILKYVDEKSKILIVTEGSSDTFILKKTIDILYPNISDLFNFIDMESNYPFTGVGELYKFCMGLAKINIQNNVIVLFDNDTAGIEKYERAIRLKKPDNLFVLKLPDFKEFETILSKGPNENNLCNINGLAVAIECFLDFKSVNFEPCIRWTNYQLNLDKYQGSLEKKDEYVKAFKKSKLINQYDVSKLRYLVDYIISSWINNKNY